MPGKLIMCHGLPASGKSTWAKEQVAEDPENTVRVNRDTIRTELFGATYHDKSPNKKKEQEVSRVQERMVREGLAKNKTVICDDTNLNQHFMLQYPRIARTMGAEIGQQHFDVSIEECKRRNRIRGEQGGRRVPDHVIDKMAEKAYGKDGRLKQFIIGEKTVFAYDKAGSDGENLVKKFNEEFEKKYPIDNTQCVNFDMDGSLVDTRKNSDKNMSNNQRNFHAFHTESEFDPPNEAVLKIADEARKAGFTVTVTTARMDTYAKPTINWLKKHGVPVSRLYMRREGDFRADYEAKKDILEMSRQDGLEFIHCVDDNPQAVRAWVENGIGVTAVPFHNPVDPSEVLEEYPVISVQSPISGLLDHYKGKEVLIARGAQGKTAEKYHINDKGEAKPCSATINPCPFGGEENHYPTAQEARKNYEKNMKSF